jgi:hypothetical protein
MFPDVSDVTVTAGSKDSANGFARARTIAVSLSLPQGDEKMFVSESCKKSMAGCGEGHARITTTIIRDRKFEEAGGIPILSEVGGKRINTTSLAGSWQEESIHRGYHAGSTRHRPLTYGN